MLRFLSAALLAFGSLSATSFYYYNDYSSGTPNVVWYGRDGHIQPSNSSNNTTITGGVIQFSGEVNNGDGNYYGIWLGRMQQEGDVYSASSQKPFGVQVIKSAARLDPSDDTSNPESHRHMNGMSFYLYSDEDVFNDAGRVLSDFTYMYEIYRSQRTAYQSPHDWSTTDLPLSMWGYYSAAETNFSMVSSVRPDNTSIDLSYQGIGSQQVEWNYDDRYSSCPSGGGTCFDNNGGGADDNGTLNENPANNNLIGMRMVHDGDTIRFFINPDPDENDPLPNEYIEAGSVAATFSNNLKFMFGVESARADTETQIASFDNLLVRSVADGDTTYAEINPTQVHVGDSVPFSLVLNPTLNTDDAGIAELKITKPSVYAGWDISSLGVFSTHGGGAAWSEISALKSHTVNNKGTNCSYSVPADGGVDVCTSGNDLIVRFRAVSSADNDVIQSADAEKRIGITFTFTAPGTPDAAGQEFAVFARNEKYDTSHTDNTTGNDGLRYATTGWQKVRAGDAHTWTSDLLKVKVLDLPVGYSTFSPSVLYVGFPQDLAHYIATPNDPNNSGIDKVEFEIYSQTYTEGNGSCTGAGISASNPDCYVDNAAIPWSDFGVSGTNFATSLLDAGLSSSLSGNTAVVQYNSSAMIPGDGGLDKITFPGTATPSVTSPSYFRVKARVFNTTLSASSTNAATGIFPAFGQFFVLRPAKPLATAMITPSVACNSNAAAYGPNAPPTEPNYTVCNNTSSSTVTFQLTNQGKDGNNIKTVRLNLPDAITSVTNVSVDVVQGGESFSFTDSSHSSKIVFNNTAGAKTLTIYLDGIKGSGDGNLGLLGSSGAKNSMSVTMTLGDSVATLSGTTVFDITGNIDNGNGDALTDNVYSQDSAGTYALTYVNPFPRAKAEVGRSTAFSYPIQDPSGSRELYVTSSNDSVRLSYKLFNPSETEDSTNAGNGIKMARIFVPAVFTSISNVTSARGGSAAVSGNEITLTYATPVAPGDFDEITFDTIENNNALSSHAFTSNVSNSTDTADYKNTAALSASSDEISFVYQPLNAAGYAEVCHNSPEAGRCSHTDSADNESNPLLIDKSLAWDNGSRQNTIRYYFTNTGMAGAPINKLRLYIRKDAETGWDAAGADALDTAWLATGDSKAFDSVTGFVNGSSSSVSCTADAAYSNKYIECDFSAAGGVDTDDTDNYIELKMGHLQSAMPSSQTISFRARGYNQLSAATGGTWYPSNNSADFIPVASTAEMANSTQQVKFSVAKPKASVQAYLTLSNAAAINSMPAVSAATPVKAYLHLKNSGVGTNYIYKAKIDIPSAWQGKISSIDNGGTSTQGATVTDNGDHLLVNYEGLADCSGDSYTVGCLTASGTDGIEITLNHTYNASASSLWSVSASNDSSPDTVVYDSGTAQSGYSLSLGINKKGLTRLTSSSDKNTVTPGNPVQLYTTDSLGSILYRLTNENPSGGLSIGRARIAIPGGFIVSNIESTQLGSSPTTYGNQSKSGYGEISTDGIGNDDGICDELEACRYVYLSYSSGLAAGDLDDISISFKKNPSGDNFSAGSHTWTAEAVYQDSTTDSVADVPQNFSGTGGDWYDLSSQIVSGGSVTTEFILPPMPASAYLSVNTNVFDNRKNHLSYAFPAWGSVPETTLDDGALSFFVKNESSIAGNDMQYIRISSPALVSSLDKTTLALKKDGTLLTAANTTSPDGQCDGWDFSTGDFCYDDNSDPKDIIVKFKKGVANQGSLLEINTKATFSSHASGDSAAFTVSVSNDPGSTNLTPAVTPVVEGESNTDRSLTLHFYEPLHAMQMYVQKTNVEDGDPSSDISLYKSGVDHSVSLFVRNAGHASAELNQITVSLPLSVFKADGNSTYALYHADGTTLFTDGTDYSCSGDCTSGTLDPAADGNGSNFIVTFTSAAATIPRDSFVEVRFTGLESSDAAVSDAASVYPVTVTAADRFQVSGRFSTGYTQTYTATVLTGKSDVMYLKQPDPSVDVTLAGDDIQLLTTAGAWYTVYGHQNETDASVVATGNKRKIRLNVTNTGNGANAISSVKITFPDFVAEYLKDPDKDGSWDGDDATLLGGEITATALSGDISGAGAEDFSSIASNTFTVSFCNAGAPVLDPNEKAQIEIPVNYKILSIPDTPATWTVEVSNQPCAAVSTYQAANLALGGTLSHAFTSPPSIVEVEVIEGKNLYSYSNEADNRAFTHTLKVKVTNGAAPLPYFAFRVPGSEFGVSSVTATSSVDGEITPQSGSDFYVIPVDYGAGTGLAANATDTVTVTLKGSMSRSYATPADYALETRIPYTGICDSGVADVTNDLLNETANCIAPTGDRDFSIIPAPFAGITGTILPKQNVKDKNIQVSVSLYDTNGTALVDFSGDRMAVNTASGVGQVTFTGGSSTLADASIAGSGKGIPMCTDIAGSSCSANKTILLKASAPGYITASKEIVLERNTYKDLGDILTLEEAPFTVGGSDENIAVGRDGTDKCAIIEIPGEAINETFFVKPKCYTVSQWESSTHAWDQKYASGGSSAILAGKKNIRKPEVMALPNVPVFALDLQDAAGNSIETMDLLHRELSKGINETKANGKITFKYKEENIAAAGWSENNLSVFAYDLYRGEWIKIGSKIDAAANTATISVGTLNRYYGIFGADSSGGVIADVTVSPRVFTPGKGSRHFDRVSLTYTINGSPNSLEVAIYTVEGKRVYFIEKPGDMGGGQIFWDGRDDNGNLVKGGIYVYVIRAGEERYRGTIVIAR